MAEKKLYKEYFQIDPKYFPQVTEALIKEGKVNWKNYFANDSFIAVLKQACDMVNGLSPLSMFTWGPYGSGKSHLLLTLISMLKAKDEEITEYFTDQNLSNDLLNKFIAMKNSGKIITIHRIGSSDITTETDLVLAVQQSVMAALDENGIDNQGSASMKDSFLEYISKPINRTYFDSLIKEDDYAWEFPEMSVDDVERIITGDNAKQSEEMLRKVMTVMKNIGQYGILKDTNAMSDWIKDIIEKNNIKAIIFAWDEFSEFLQNHPMGLTGFQTLLEISNSHPFYFIIVTHGDLALKHVHITSSDSNRVNVEKTLIAISAPSTRGNMGSTNVEISSSTIEMISADSTHGLPSVLESKTRLKQFNLAQTTVDQRSSSSSDKSGAILSLSTSDGEMDLTGLESSNCNCSTETGRGGVFYLDWSETTPDVADDGTQLLPITCTGTSLSRKKAWHGAANSLCSFHLFSTFREAFIHIFCFNCSSDSLMFSSVFNGICFI